MSRAHIKHLRKLWEEQEKYHEPWTTGVVDLSGSQLSLLLKLTDSSWHHFQIGSITPADIDLLLSKSDPATFGRGPNDVLDETYRKAWKLDEESFCWRFNPDSGEFVSRLTQGLCPWDSFEKGIRVEPYKLNVYGQGGFFKTHKDTPHAENMFGSLVFTLPTQYEGGNLNLRHRTRQLSFDATALLQSASPTSVAYVAFYSDVDHEVLEVTSGHRITITFNLYFDEFRAPAILPKKKLVIPRNPFMLALQELTNDANFCKTNKYLGFGLEHDYPMKVEGHQGANTEFQDKRHRYLKGPDALLYRSLTDMGLRPTLQLLYNSSNIFHGSAYFWVMHPGIIPGEHEDDANDEKPLSQFMDMGARIVWKDSRAEKEIKMDEERSIWEEGYMKNIKEYKPYSINIHWVTKPTDNLTGETPYIELGNEAHQEIFYFSVCIVVKLPASTDSTDEEMSEVSDDS